MLKKNYLAKILQLIMITSILPKSSGLGGYVRGYIGENSNDTHALLLYGKFLRKVGQNEHALSYFLRADSINPKLAVVKQQIANYLVEKQRPVDALLYSCC